MARTVFLALPRPDEKVFDFLWENRERTLLVLSTVFSVLIAVLSLFDCSSFVLDCHALQRCLEGVVKVPQRCLRGALQVHWRCFEGL